MVYRTWKGFWMRILLVEDDITIRLSLQRVMERLGHDVHVVSDGRAGMIAWRSYGPDVVVSDIQMPIMSGIDMLREMRLAGFDTPVIILTGSDSWQHVVLAMEAKANHYLRKPVRVSLLEGLLRRIEVETSPSVKTMEEPADLRGLVGNGLFFEIPNRIDLPRAVAEMLVRRVEERLDPPDAFGLRVGLSELVMNAMEHGNLEICGEEKAAALAGEADSYLTLWNTRMEQPEFTMRRVRIQACEMENGCVWEIRDEGPGFDWLPYLSTNSPVEANSLHGRGIFVSKFQFDFMEYDDGGRTVRAGFHWRL